jgi:hypothetical protein
VRTEVSGLNEETSAPSLRPFRISIRQGMIAVAAAAVVFGLFGVNWSVTMVIVAFVISALVTKPDVWQGWALLSIAAVAALPFMLLAFLYTFAFRAALYIGHWPSYNKPDPKVLRAHFFPQTEFLEFLVPTFISIAVTCLFVTQVIRFATWPRRLEFALWVALLLWLFAFLFLGGDPAGVLNWMAD